MVWEGAFFVQLSYSYSKTIPCQTLSLGTILQRQLHCTVEAKHFYETESLGLVAVRILQKILYSLSKSQKGKAECNFIVRFLYGRLDLNSV